MVNDCARRCKTKIFFAGKRNFSLNKAKKEKKLFCVDSLDQFRRLEVREKARILMKCFCDKPTSVGLQGIT